MFTLNYGLAKGEASQEVNYNVLFGFSSHAEVRVDPHTHVQYAAPSADLSRVAELVRPKYLGPEQLSGEKTANEHRRND